MVKYYCDRCGKDLTKERRIGYIAINARDKADGDLVEDNEFEKCHYCQKCISAVKRFLISAPDEACAEPKSDENTQNETEIVQNEPENTQNETEIAQNEPENDQIDPADGKAGKRKRIDIGKIMALRNANWQVKDIADEMHLTPLQVSQAIYNYKKKHAQKVEE